MSDFELHPRLKADTHFVADWTLSRVLLMNDSRYPWLVLVPMRLNLVELHDLALDDLRMLAEEMARGSCGLKALTGAAKINIGALGNLAPQLHIHAVARHPGDDVWPGPVWGQGVAIPYQTDAIDRLLQRLRAAL